MSEYKIIKLSNKQELKDEAAKWFHSKWGVPLEAYQESIEDSLKPEAAIPSWYVCLDNHNIIGGLGVIENDFHNRKDLTPNVCALYIEKDYRGQGIAGELLNYVCADMAEQGIYQLYLLTDHTEFYERYGWEFYCMVQGDGEPNQSRMYIHRYKE